jgi:pilus assembly protein CpaF
MVGLTEDDRENLRTLVRERRNILVSGASGTGKTTLLAAILAEAAHTERIVLIEDLAELQVAHPHVVSLEARQPNIEGVGGIDVATLIREALRMRPDRLIVGECRGGEVAALLMALNTGHAGGGGTIHANSLDDVPARLEALGALAGLSVAALTRQAASGIDVVIHVEKSDGIRRIASMGRLVMTDDGTLRAVHD